MRTGHRMVPSSSAECIAVSFAESPPLLLVSSLEPQSAGANKELAEIVLFEPADSALDNLKAALLPLGMEEKLANRLLRHELRTHLRPESLLLEPKAGGRSHGRHDECDSSGDQGVHAAAC